MWRPHKRPGAEPAISTLRSALALAFLGAATLSLASAGCSSRADDVCEGFCDKLKQCGTSAGECGCDDYSDCANEDDILDHIDRCSSESCEGYNGCLLQKPACTE